MDITSKGALVLPGHPGLFSRAAPPNSVRPHSYACAAPPNSVRPHRYACVAVKHRPHSAQFSCTAAYIWPLCHTALFSLQSRSFGSRATQIRPLRCTAACDRPIFSSASGRQLQVGGVGRAGAALCRADGAQATHAAGPCLATDAATPRASARRRAPPRDAARPRAHL